jgi:phytoene dehydrogenase-like protein
MGCMSDVIVVGAGPNGLAAAVELLRSGRSARVLERSAIVGGGTRTLPLTLPGYLHDVCSAVHPMAIASPFMRGLDLAGLGVELIQPPIPVTHPLDGGRAGVLHRDVEETAALLAGDGSRYRRLMQPFAARADRLADDVLGPFRVPPRHLATIPFGMAGLPSATILGKRFRGDEARALLAGLAAHSLAPLTRPFTGAVAVWFAATGHAFGWPVVRGGSAELGRALAEAVVALGGSVETGIDVQDLDDIDDRAAIVLDLMPAAAVRIGGRRVSPRSRTRLVRWRHGPGVFKVDWALDGPIPWADPWSGSAGTVHVGGTFEEVEAAEAAVHDGRHPERPFVLLSQPTLFDPSRAPEGKHTAWAYCHVPTGSVMDMTAAIEAQVERFAPGFHDLILARHTMGPKDFEAANPNDVGGDIAGGAFGTWRVVGSAVRNPYRIGDGVYLCSSATPPGAGVHGMCGYHAARTVIRDLRRT